MKDYTVSIRSFIVENFLFGKDDDLQDDTSFLEEGIFDSTAVIELVEAMLDKSGAIGHLADVPAFKTGAGRQYDIGKFGFALEPDPLVDDKFEVFAPIGPDPAVGVAHGADERAAVTV